MRAQIQARLHPVYFLGDSHSAIFNYLLFHTERGLVLGKSLLFYNLRLGGLIDEDGELAAPIQEAMRHEHLIQHAQQYPLPIMYQGTRSLMRQSESPPIIVIFCGNIDLYVLMKQLGEDYDLVLPDVALQQSEREKPPQYVPLAELRAQIQPALSKLAVGLQWFKQRNFRVALHELPPPYCEEDLLEEKSGFRCPLDVRIRLTLFFNREMRALAQQYQVPFLSLWEQITEQDQLKPEYVLDGLHLNRQAAELTVQNLAEHFLLDYFEAPEQEKDLAAQVERLYETGQAQDILNVLASHEEALPDAEQLMFKGPQEQSRWGKLRLRQSEALALAGRWEEVLELQREYADLLNPLLQSHLFDTGLSPTKLEPPESPLSLGLWWCGDRLHPPQLPEDLLGVDGWLVVSALEDPTDLTEAWLECNPGMRGVVVSPATFNAPRWQRCLKGLELLGWHAPLAPEDVASWQFILNLAPWMLRCYVAEPPAIESGESSFPGAWPVRELGMA